MTRKFLALVVLSLMASPSYAERLPFGSSLSGYQCYHIDVKRLNLTKEDVFAGHGFPAVWEGPSTETKKLGVAPDLVYVEWPLRQDNGFVHIVRLGGQLGWIAKDAIKPLYREPSSTGGCTLFWYKDGTIHSHLDPGTKAWLWPDGHDLPANR